MNEYRYILPEIAVSRYETRRRPTFPDACPACGAVRTAELSQYRGADYACGATYREKPQIQNHTDKWWGHCPVTKREVEATQ